MLLYFCYSESLFFFSVFASLHSFVVTLACLCGHFHFLPSFASLPAAHELFGDIVTGVLTGWGCDVVGPSCYWTLLPAELADKQELMSLPTDPTPHPSPPHPPVISDRPSFAFIQRLIRASKWSGSSPSRGVRRSARLPKMTGIQKLLTQGAFASHNWLLHSVCLSRAISVRP